MTSTAPARAGTGSVVAETAPPESHGAPWLPEGSSAGAALHRRHSPGQAASGHPVLSVLVCAPLPDPQSSFSLRSASHARCTLASPLAYENAKITRASLKHASRLLWHVRPCWLVNSYLIINAQLFWGVFPDQEIFLPLGCPCLQVAHIGLDYRDSFLHLFFLPGSCHLPDCPGDGLNAQHRAGQIADV